MPHSSIITIIALWVSPVIGISAQSVLGTSPSAQGVTLTPLDATAVEASRSILVVTPARITFVNQSGVAVDIYWITFEGKRMLYRSALVPGASWKVGTFLKHRWLVVVSGSGATAESDTGVRFAGFEAVTQNGDMAFITGAQGTVVPTLNTEVASPIVQEANSAPADPQAAVRALIKNFADARNSHDGIAAAALYSEGGEWIGPKGIHGSPSSIVVGRPNLAKMWAAAPGQVKRTIESVEFPGPNVAVVRGLTEFPDIGFHHETFVIVKDHFGWTIRVHQALD